MVKQKEKAITPKVEGSTEIALPQRGVDIVGLQDVPTSIIPIPFYKLVQPGSTGVTLNNGKEAEVGTIFMRDSKMAVASLEFYLLRAKRQVSNMTRDDGSIARVVRIGVLGVTKDEYSPFIMSVPVSSFSSFGSMVKQLQDKKVVNSWEYSITATTEKIETQKMVQGSPKMVKFYVFNFAVSKDKIDKKVVAALEETYRKLGGSLDRGDDIGNGGTEVDEVAEITERDIDPEEAPY